MNLSGFPQLNYYQKLFLRGGNNPFFPFLTSIEYRTALLCAFTSPVYLPVNGRKILMLFAVGTKMKVQVPTTIFDDEVGEPSVISLVKKFGASVRTSPSPDFLQGYNS